MFSYDPALLAVVQTGPRSIADVLTTLVTIETT
jgi:hypothetical protein